MEFYSYLNYILNSNLGMVPLNCYHQEDERPESQPTSKISISEREEDMMTEINFPLNGNANM